MRRARRPSPTTVRRTVAPSLALALLLTACSSEDDPGTASGGSPGSDTATPAPAATAPADPSAADPSPAGPSPTGTDSAEGDADPLEPPEDLTRLAGVVDVDSVSDRPSTLATWQELVPGVQDVRIRSTADGVLQPALWLPPSGDEPQPLLVGLHSWSTRYLQDAVTPYGQWAAQEGWAFVSPNFRGVSERPEAAGSELVVSDVLDAVDYAIAQGGVDPERVYVAGWSGGGMVSLLMAGRAPERFAGAVAWVPVADLVDWYAYNSAERPQEDYADQIRAACGGDPTADPQARASCVQRSPLTHLDAAREAGVPVYIGHGLSDETVPPDHSVRSYDALADAQDRLGGPVRAAVRDGRLPDDVPGEPAEDFFAEQDPEVLLARRSADVTLVLFEGQHDTVFHPGLQFLAALAERETD